jgi:hypothetical protein
VSWLGAVFISDAGAGNAFARVRRIVIQSWVRTSAPASSRAHSSCSAVLPGTRKVASNVATTSP